MVKSQAARRPVLRAYVCICLYRVAQTTNSPCTFQGFREKLINGLSLLLWERNISYSIAGKYDTIKQSFPFPESQFTGLDQWCTNSFTGYQFF